MGIEPSTSMRKIAADKLGDTVRLFDGDFLDFPNVEVDTIVSTYAFHHLTDDEKGTSITCYGNLLATGGKIVFADTMYESEETYKRAIDDALEKGFLNLAEDLQREYYPTIPFLKKLMEQNGFQVSFKRWNNFVWIMEGVKQ
jgi:putative AdoMet-dependent methyltransferase